MFTKSIIFKEKILTVFTALCLFFLIIGFLTVYFSIAKLTSPLILHFDNVLGIDFFGETQSLWFMWVTGLLVVLFNLFLGYYLFYRERALSYLLFGITALFSLFNFVAILQVISLN